MAAEALLRDRGAATGYRELKSQGGAASAQSGASGRGATAGGRQRSPAAGRARTGRAWPSATSPRVLPPAREGTAWTARNRRRRAPEWRERRRRGRRPQAGAASASVPARARGVTVPQSWPRNRPFCVEMHVLPLPLRWPRRLTTVRNPWYGPHLVTYRPHPVRPSRTPAKGRFRRQGLAPYVLAGICLALVAALPALSDPSIRTETGRSGCSTRQIERARSVARAGHSAVRPCQAQARAGSAESA